MRNQLPGIEPPAPRVVEPEEKDFSQIVKSLCRLTRKLNALNKLLPDYSSINLELTEKIQQFKKQHEVKK